MNNLKHWNSNNWQESLLEVIRQNIAGYFENKAQKCFAFTPQANFLAHNSNFYWKWRWWDWIQAIFLNLFYFTVLKIFMGLALVNFQKYWLLRAYCSNVYTVQGRLVHLLCYCRAWPWPPPTCIRQKKINKLPGSIGIGLLKKKVYYQVFNV